MTTYQWLGAISIGLFVIMLVLMALVFVGRHSLKRVYWISGVALSILFTLCVLVSIIYWNYA